MARKNKGSSFIKQAAILACAGLLVRVIGFLYRLPLTNMIGDEGNGIYSAGYYLYNFFLVMSSAGLPVAISKMVAERIALGQYTNARRTFRVSMIVAGTLGLICTLLMLAFAEQFCSWIRSERSYYCIITLAPTVFVCSIMSVYRGYFQGRGTTVPTALSQIVEQIFNAVLSVYFAWLLMNVMGKGVEFGAAGGTAGTGIGALAGLITIIIIYVLNAKSINQSYSEDKRDYPLQSFREIASDLFRIAIPVITGTAIFSMTNLIDMVMVNSRLEATGIYTSEEIDALYGLLTGKYVTLTTLPVVISTSLATAAIPTIATSMVLKDTEAVKTKVDTTLRVTMIVSIPAAVGLGALGDQILYMLFPNYPAGGSLLKAGALSIILLALSQISTGVLQGIGKVKAPALNALIGSIAKIPVNYFLIAIPDINIIGAVISTTVCYLFASLLNFRALVKATEVKPDYVGMLVKPSIASVFMALVCIFGYKFLYMLIPNNTVATVIVICFAIIVYFIAMVLIKGFAREDLRVLPMGGRLVAFLERYGLM